MAARDSSSASFSPCLTSMRNQLSMPRFEEVQREQVHDQQWRDHQRAEGAHRARRQARPGDIGRGSRCTSCQILRAISTVRPITPIRFSSRIHSCRRPNSEEFCTLLASSSNALVPMTAHSRPERVGAPGAARWCQVVSDHVYQSLTRLQSSVQNSSARSEEDRCPRWMPARTLITYCARSRAAAPPVSASRPRYRGTAARRRAWRNVCWSPVCGSRTTYRSLTVW